MLASGSPRAEPLRDFATLDPAPSARSMFTTAEVSLGLYVSFHAYFRPKGLPHLKPHVLLLHDPVYSKLPRYVLKTRLKVQLLHQLYLHSIGKLSQGGVQG
jgi:hypothetical protein